MKKLLLLVLLPLVAFGQPRNGPYPPSLAGKVDLQWTNGTTWYVASWGDDINNTGRSQFAPFYSTEKATLSATNGDTIHLMNGTNNFAAQSGSVFPYNSTIQLPNGVNWYSEPNAWLVRTNSGTGGGDTTRALFYAAGNNIINNLKMLNNDDYNSECFVGYGQSDSAIGHTNIIFNNPTLIGYGTVLHYENGAGTTSSNRVEVIFYNPTILANACPIVLRGWRNLTIKIVGGDITTWNFTNNIVVNTKPIRAVDIETTVNVATNTPALICTDVIFHMNDTELSNSNRPAYWIWNQVTGKSNIATFAGCVVDWTSLTNPASLDITNSVANSVNVFQCYRTDGSNLTYTSGLQPNFGYLNAASISGAGMTNQAGYASVSTNTLIVTSSGLTNLTGSNYLVSVTAGTALVVKDGAGNQFLAPVLGMSFPLKPGWQFTGTAVTGIAVQDP